jgi:PAS domain S-box-containing protein
VGEVASMKSENSTARRAGAGFGTDTEVLRLLGAESGFLQSISGAQVFDFIGDMPVGVLLFDSDDRLVRCNKKALAVAGANATAYVPGTPFEEIVRSAVDAGMVDAALGREDDYIAERLAMHRNPGAPFVMLAEGRWIQVYEHVVEGVGFVVFHTDITDIKRTEEALRESEGKFRSLVEGSLQGVCIHRDLRPIFANQAFADIFGYDNVDEVLALDSLLLLFPEHQWRDVATRARERQDEPNATETVVQQAVRRNGEFFFVESRLGVIEWEGTPAMQVSVIDVTERETMTRLKDEFVSTVSHELRTPLTSISGALGLIASGMAGHVPPKVKELIEIANNNAERLVRLIGDILDVQKIESGRIGGTHVAIQVAQLLETAADANRGLAENNDLSINVVDDTRGAKVVGDLDQLMQVMTNLLSNAIKFSPPKGKIEVMASRRGGQIEIAVSDQGPGVPPEYRDSVFEKFVQVESTDTRARGGTGLGLSICRSLVEHHGGSMGYEDVAAGGARFWFRLPMATGD